MRRALGFLVALTLFAEAVEMDLRWSQLPKLPDAEGFAGAFAGVSDGALIVAGGANIVGDRWSEPLPKKWYDTVWILPKPDGEWTKEFRLPQALGYGVSLTVDDSVLCLGGSDAARHYADVYRLQWRDGSLIITTLPPLPKPCAHACGALVGRTIYLAGGLQNPTDTTALKTFWALDLDEPSPAWKELPVWPGPERMLAVAAGHDGSFFLFSGVSLAAGAEGKPVRTYLRDAYRFTPGAGWKRLADLPRPAVAAPSPAAVVGGRLLVFSGDDGGHVDFTPLKDHPGFPRDVLAYDPVRDTWEKGGAVPFSRATAPGVMWRQRYVVPNGEVRPRVRTPEVWALSWP